MRPTLVLNVVGLTPALLGDATPNLSALAREGGMRDVGWALRCFHRDLDKLGYNAVMIWPMLETMPDPLTPSDQARRCPPGPVVTDCLARSTHSRAQILTVQQHARPYRRQFPGTPLAIYRGTTDVLFTRWYGGREKALPFSFR